MAQRRYSSGFNEFVECARLGTQVTSTAVKLPALMLAGCDAQTVLTAGW